MVAGIAINPSEWDAHSATPGGRIGSPIRAEFDMHVRRTRHLEHIAAQHYKGATPGLYKFAGCTPEELEEACEWTRIQDEIAEREEALEYCWSVEKSLKKVNYYRLKVDSLSRPLKAG